MMHMHFGDERTIVDGPMAVSGMYSKVPNGMLTTDPQDTTTTQPTHC